MSDELIDVWPVDFSEAGSRASSLFFWEWFGSRSPLMCSFCLTNGETCECELVGLYTFYDMLLLETRRGEV
jgi:hypothetical protein